MDKTTYFKNAEKAKAMSIEEQQVYARHFDRIVLLDEISDWISWLSAYYKQMSKVSSAFTDDNYLAGPYVENNVIKRLFVKDETETAVDTLTKAAQKKAEDKKDAENGN